MVQNQLSTPVSTCPAPSGWESLQLVRWLFSPDRPHLLLTADEQTSRSGALRRSARSLDRQLSPPMPQFPVNLNSNKSVGCSGLLAGCCGPVSLVTGRRCQADAAACSVGGDAGSAPAVESKRFCLQEGRSTKNSGRLWG